jgi:hypothetical protein
MKTIIKIDLDKYFLYFSKKELRKRLNFLYSLKIINLKDILYIEWIKKSKWSCRIHYNNTLKNELDLIIIQSVLGDDWKRTAITFRDFKLNIENYNRIFDYKQYSNNKIKKGKIIIENYNN